MSQGNVRNIQHWVTFCLMVVANATRYIKNVGFTGGVPYIYICIQICSYIFANIPGAPIAR